MWRYWMTGKPSNRIARRIWFAILVCGVWYGAILYYFLAYLPGTGKGENENLERPANETQGSEDMRANGDRGKMRVFGRTLLSAWLLLFLTVALAFAFPKPFSRIIGLFAPYFQLIPMFLLIVTATYGLIRVYRAGMIRTK